VLLDHVVLVGDGKIVEIRFHTLTTKVEVLRYLAVIVKVENVHTRTKNKYNEEERIDLKKDTKYRVDLDKAKQLLAPSYDKLLDTNLISHIATRDYFEFWGKADDIKKN